MVQEGIWRKRVRQRKASHARWQADAWTNTDWGLDRDDVGCRSWWYAQGSTRAGKYPGDAPHLRHERRRGLESSSRKRRKSGSTVRQPILGREIWTAPRPV